MHQRHRTTKMIRFRHARKCTRNVRVTWAQVGIWSTDMPLLVAPASTRCSRKYFLGSSLALSPASRSVRRQLHVPLIYETKNRNTKRMQVAPLPRNDVFCSMPSVTSQRHFADACTSLYNVNLKELKNTQRLEAEPNTKRTFVHSSGSGTYRTSAHFLS